LSRRLVLPRDLGKELQAISKASGAVKFFGWKEDMSKSLRMITAAKAEKKA